ncbi:MAG: hypothetical protein ACQEXJ_21210 [Myxococcota bacterium]
MLRADGLSRSQFMPMWRDAMWHAVDPAERARLVLELGRLAIREEGRASPLLVAYSAHRDPPFSVMALTDAPSQADAPELRQTVEARLAEMGATEVYVLLTLQAGERDGVAQYVLTSWGETLDGEEACWMQAYRHRGERVEEAPAMGVPDPTTTEISRRLTGLLTRHH